MKTKPQSFIRERIITALQGAGIVGLTTVELRELTGISADEAAGYLERMLASKQTFGNGKGLEKRYYSDQESADRGISLWMDWCEKRRAEIAQRRRDRVNSCYARKAKTKPQTDRPERVRKIVPSRAQAPWGPDEPAIIPKNVKITIAPTPPQALRTNTHSRIW